MRLSLALPLAVAGCLSAPPGSTGDSADVDAATDAKVRLLGVFSRDAFTDLAQEDLAVAVVYRERPWIVHLRAVDQGLDALMEAGEADELPFEPVAMVGADATGDNAIDLLATSAGGELALLASTPEGLGAAAIEVSLDSGAPFEAITTVDAPDLSGEERVFLMGPQGIWMSDRLDASGIIHFDEITPAMNDVPDPAIFFAGHDDDFTFYVGVAQATAVDLWPIDLENRVRQADLIAYATPSPPALGYWRRMQNPLRVDFFGVIPGSNLVAWVSEQFGASEMSNSLSPAGDAGPIRYLTIAQQPEGFDLITASEGAGGMVGVQVVRSLGLPEDTPAAPVTIELSSSIDTDGPFWVLPAEVSATPYAGKELLVFDEAGHVACVTFDDGHTSLSSCGEADLRNYMAGWTGG